MSDLADEILLESEEKMEKAIEHTSHELNTVRTGRANPKILDSVHVDYYGCPTPLKQLSSISCPEANQLYIKPYDKSTIKLIEQALAAANLGLNPQSDATGIRIVFPQMTEERRKEMTKIVSKMGEQGKVMIRNVRRDSNDQIKKLELAEDEETGYLDDVQKLTDQYVAKVDQLVNDKNKDLLTI